MLVPGVSCEPGDVVLCREHRIRLRMPGGAHLDTTVPGIEHIRYIRKPEKVFYPILLPEDITKDDVPVGTEVLLLEEKYETVRGD